MSGRILEGCLPASASCLLRSLYIGKAVKFASLVLVLKNVVVDGGRRYGASATLGLFLLQRYSKIQRSARISRPPITVATMIAVLAPEVRPEFEESDVSDPFGGIVDGPEFREVEEAVPAVRLELSAVFVPPGLVVDLWESDLVDAVVRALLREPPVVVDNPDEVRVVDLEADRACAVAFPVEVCV